MIAVDSSALMAIVLGEPEAKDCITALEAENSVVISAVTLAEALIVAAGRGVAREMAELIDDLSIEVETVSAATARRVAAAHRRWGKGVHPAGLNFGDCFAYEVAKTHHCPLLFIGNDFAKTDIISVL